MQTVTPSAASTSADFFVSSIHALPTKQPGRGLIRTEPNVPALKLLVIDLFASTSHHLFEALTQESLNGREAPSVQLIERHEWDGAVAWICAAAVSPQELDTLQRLWLDRSHQCFVLIGSNQVGIVSRTLHALTTQHRRDSSFRAVIMSSPDASVAGTTCRIAASQSGGWMQHQTKDMAQPQHALAKAMSALAGQAWSEATPLISTNLSVQAVEPDGTTQTLSESIDLESNKSSTLTSNTERNPPMATLNDSMNACMQIDGAMAAALVDMGSGMALAKVGGGVNLDMAAAGNTEVLKAKLKTMASLGIQDTIEDMLITLGKQYHLIRPVPHKQGLFLYLVLDKTKGNLAMARFKLMEVEKSITV